MKVLHITNAFPTVDYSSYGIFIKEQIESLINKNVECETVFINAKKNGILEYFRSRSVIKKKIKEFQPNILHAHHEFSLIPLIFVRFKQPLILSLLGDIEKRSFINKLIYKALSLKADKIIFKNRLPKGKKYCYLPNGVNTELFRPIDQNYSKEKLGLNLNKKYVLFVSASKVNPIKRYDKFSAIVSKLNEQFGNFEELLMTNVSREETPYYFNACEFLLLTSDHEGSPNAVKEALACNKPIVSTDVGNVKQMLEKSTSSFVSARNSIEELFELSIRVLDSAAKLNERDLIFEQNLAIKTVADELIKIYNTVVK